MIFLFQKVTDVKKRKKKKPKWTILNDMDP